MADQTERFPDHARYADILNSPVGEFDANVVVGTFIRPPGRDEVSDLL